MPEHSASHLVYQVYTVNQVLPFIGFLLLVWCDAPSRRFFIIAMTNCTADIANQMIAAANSKGMNRNDKRSA